MKENEVINIEGELINLKSSFEMYEKTKKETIKNMKSAIDPNTGKKKFKESDIDSKISLINGMQEDIVQKYIEMGGDINDLNSLKSNKSTTKNKMSKKENNNLHGQIFSLSKGENKISGSNLTVYVGEFDKSL